MSIKRKSDPYDPDYVIVVDETLLHSVNVTDGLDRNGAIIVNTPRPAREIRPLLRGYEGRVYTVDAREISERTLGKNFPNTRENEAERLMETAHIQPAQTQKRMIRKNSEP